MELSITFSLRDSQIRLINKETILHFACQEIGFLFLCKQEPYVFLSIPKDV